MFYIYGVIQVMEIRDTLTKILLSLYQVHELKIKPWNAWIHESGQILEIIKLSEKWKCIN